MDRGDDDDFDGLGHLRDLMKSMVSLDAVYWKLNERRRQNGATASTVEALMFSLRERGLAALQEPATQRRMRELSDSQVIEVGKRLQALKIGHAWADDEIETFMRVKEGLT